MKKYNHYFFWAGAALLVLLCIFSFGLYRKISDDNTITVGFFSDSYWDVQNGYSYQILDDAIALFEEEHPGVKVEYVSGVMKDDYTEWLSAGLISGDAPDLFLVLPDDFNNLVQVGALENLESYESRDENYDSEAFFDSAYAYGKYKNEQYALPYECASTLMFVNTTILKENDIDMPEESWTWDDFYKICEKCTKDTNGDGIIDQFGSYGYGWQDAFASNDVQVFNDQGTKCNLSGEKVEEAVDFLEKLENLNQEAVSSEKDFDQGNVVFQPMSFSQFKAYKPYPLSIKKYSGFEWGCLPMPAGSSGSNISSLDTLLLGMNAKSDHKELAWEFMKTLTCNEEIQNEIFDYSDGLSVLKEVTQNNRTLKELIGGENLNINMLSNAIEKAVVTPHFRNYSEAVNMVDKAVREILDSDLNIHANLLIHNRDLNQQISEMSSNASS